MRRLAMMGILALAAAALAAATVSDVRAQPPQTLQPQEVFSGVLTLQRPQPSRVKVTIHLWTIREGQKHASLPLPGKGMLVVQVRAGSATIIVGGKGQERREGEFVTVPAGVTFGVETGGDTAVLQTVLIEE